MAAIQGTRISSSSVVGLFVVAISAALSVGATRGYLVRALSAPVLAPSSPVEQRVVTAAELPS